MTAADARLRFSVVIPSYNRSEQIVRCAEHVLRQNLGEGDFELVIVGDGSMEPVERMLAHLPKKHLTIVRQTNAGPARARNQGAARSRGKYLVFTDDDCLPMPDWLREFGANLAAHGDRVLGGQVENGLSGSAFAECTHLLTYEKYHEYEAEAAEIDFVTTNNLLVPRRIFDAVGGFDEAYLRPGYEDAEFSARVSACGHCIGFTPTAVVRHEHAMNLIGFIRQHLNYGRGAHRFYRTRRGDRQQERKKNILTFYRGVAVRCLQAPGVSGAKLNYPRQSRGFTFIN